MKIRITLGRAFRAFYLSTLVFGIGWAAYQAHDRRAIELTYLSAVADVPVMPPDGPPEVSQASIDLAMAMFGIAVPSSADWPILDTKIEDRGLTTRGAFLHKAEVSIGPAAFSSWALLGSTLAHELEIHCEQNFLFIYLMDLVGLDGTGEAERQAYRHEIANAKRFGLPGYEKILIAETMDYYYPDFGGKKNGWPLALKAWMAKNLLHPKVQI